jgi:hypothetical protein
VHLDWKGRARTNYAKCVVVEDESTLPKVATAQYGPYHRMFPQRDHRRLVSVLADGADLTRAHRADSGGNDRDVPPAAGSTPRAVAKREMSGTMP